MLATVVMAVVMRRLEEMSETDGTRQEQRRVDREAVFNLYLHKWLPVCEAKKNCQLGKTSHVCRKNLM